MDVATDTTHGGWISIELTSLLRRSRTLKHQRDLVKSGFATSAQGPEPVRHAERHGRERAEPPPPAHKILHQLREVTRRDGRDLRSNRAACLQ